MSPHSLFAINLLLFALNALLIGLNWRLFRDNHDARIENRATAERLAKSFPCAYCLGTGRVPDPTTTDGLWHWADCPKCRPKN